MLILFYYYLLSVICNQENLYSATIRDNKLYTIFRELSSYSVKLKIYDLKDGPIIDTINSEKSSELIHIFKGFGLVFIDIPDDSEDSYNKLWMTAESAQFLSGKDNANYTNWVGYLKLDDKSLITDSSILKFPTHENFPVKGYTINKITNEFGSALYIIGGVLHSKLDNKFSYTNSIFKYNFTSKEWVDMTYLANGKLKPLIGHKSAVVNGRYLVILGGYLELNKDELERPVGNETNLNLNYLYNMTVFDTFDNNCESVSIKPDIFDTSKTNIQYIGFLSTVYRNKIVVIGGGAFKGRSNSGISNPYLGILDYNSKTWVWKEIYYDNGSKYYRTSSKKELLVYDSQLIILPVFEFSESYPIEVYDMHSLSMKSTLKLSVASNIKDPYKAVPAYLIIIIALGCTALLIVFIYLLYHKIKISYYKNGSNKYSGPILEVWSNPDMNNTNNTITWDKKKGLYIKQNTSSIIYFNGLHPNLDNQNTLNLVEFSQ